MCKVFSVFIIICLVSASRDLECTSASVDGKREDGAECVSSREPSPGEYSPGLTSNLTGAPRELPTRTRTRRQAIQHSKSGFCILPEHPRQGTYIVGGLPKTAPGQTFDSFKLTVGCRRGYGFVANGAGGTGALNVFCTKGDWSQTMPICVRFCKLTPDPSVHHTCDGGNPCEEYVPPGTRVRPVCNSLYHSNDGLQDMFCVNGYWDYVARCKVDCGRVTPEAEQLLSGGERAKRGELPWHAGIYTKTTTPFMQICGGSLVSTNAVISAAHCFWSDSKKLLPPTDYAVAIGKVHRPWIHNNDFSAQRSDVKEIRIPRFFQGHATNLQEDIAVVILTTPITYKTYVRPVCLNFDLNFENLQLTHGNLGKVAGWGLISANGMPSQILRSVQLPFISDEDCLDFLPQYFLEYITGDKLCAGYTNGTALCKGDSGGGLAFPYKNFGIERYYLRGVVSAVPPDDDKLCNDQTYATFTKVSKHADFIKESLVASMNKSCPPNVFQCDDGACRDQGVDCNGRRDCADGSDEAPGLCVPDISTMNIATTVSAPKVLSNCAQPVYEHSTFDVVDLVNDTLKLTIYCEEGYILEDIIPETTQLTLYCINGEWNRYIPKCVSSSCTLNPDASFFYYCVDPTTKELDKCKEPIAPGTTVVPVCKNRDFHTTTGQNMTCTGRTWDYVANCSIECGRPSQENGNEVEVRGVRRVNPSAYPWHVTIFLKDKPQFPICSGSLISHDKVLTIIKFVNSTDVSIYEVAAGKLYGTLDDNRKYVNTQTSDVKEVRAMVEREKGYDFSLTIVFLASPFIFNAFIRPVCINFNELFYVDKEYAKLAVWVIESSQNNNISSLNEVDIKLRACSTATAYSGGNIKPGFRLCGNFYSDRKMYSYHGVAGGGLVVPKKTDGVTRWYLQGVVNYFIRIIYCSHPSGQLIDITGAKCIETSETMVMGTDFIL